MLDFEHADSVLATMLHISVFKFYFENSYIKHPYTDLDMSVVQCFNQK